MKEYSHKNTEVVQPTDNYCPIWDMKRVETSLEYELTPFPLSLFSNKDQKMNKVRKASFSNTSLKRLTDPLDLTDQPCSSLVVDGAWLLYMVKWKEG